MLGLTAQEFAACTNLVAEVIGAPALKPGTIKNIEAGGRCPEPAARCSAEVIDQAMSGKLFPDLAGATRSKLSKPDTTAGWETIRDYAAGVPLPVFLHQRLYGGAFRQLLDATSSKRGDLIEDAVQEVFEANGISFVRTGSHNPRQTSWSMTPTTFSRQCLNAKAPTMGEPHGTKPLDSPLCTENRFDLAGYHCLPCLLVWAGNVQATLLAQSSGIRTAGH
jgi:hypothetical protein